MKIVSMTLTGDHAHVIVGALQSVVGWVDQCIIVDTGSKDGALGVAQSIVGEKYFRADFPWVNDCGAARNYALKVAGELGADWAIMLDTDERILLNGEDLRATLSETTGDLVYLPDVTGTYVKERCFRIPATERYQGPVHECYPYAAGRTTTSKARFQEIPKSPEEYQRRFERDLSVLTAYVQEHPADPRWHFYLGETLRYLKRNEEAIASYSLCANLKGWDEESAWACYRAAECSVGVGELQKAIEYCSLGLSRHAGIAELAWLAGFCAYRLENWAQAVYWSRLAITHGLYVGGGVTIPRIGFRNPSALYEGPFDTLRFALRKMGDTVGAVHAEQSYRDAITKRLETT